MHKETSATVSDADVSFFSLADKYTDPYPKPHTKPLRRCFSLARGLGAKTIIEEELPADDDGTTRDAQLLARENRTLERRRFKVSFSSATRDEVLSSRPEVPQCLGYVIVHNDTTHSAVPGAIAIESQTKTYVSEAVMTPPDMTGFCVTAAKEFTHETDEFKTTVHGALFMQQPGHIACCAHADIVMVGRTVGSPKLRDYADVNALLGTQAAFSLANEGLSARDIISVLVQAGLNADYLEYRNTECDDEETRGSASPADEDTEARDMRELFPLGQMVYYATESGFPVILAFNSSGQGHVVEVVGHVFDEHTWLPEAEDDYFDLGQAHDGLGNWDTRYLRSASWTRHFVIQDDNFGPYYCLPPESLSEKAQGSVFFFVIPPVDCPFVPQIAEVVAATVFSNVYLDALPDEGIGLWLQRLVWSAGQRKIILRTVWAERDSYIAQLAKESKLEPDAWFRENLPERFWLVEVSIPELYTANKAKLADIFVGVTENEEDEEFTLEIPGVRVPGYICTQDEDGGIALLEVQPGDYLPLYRVR